MSKGLFLIQTNTFFELINKLVIGSGPDVEISLKGEIAPMQAHVFLQENEAYLKNLETKFPILVNKKILNEKFSLPLANFTLIELGPAQFIYSEEGPLRTFQVNKILKDFDLVDAKSFDKEILEKVSNIQNQIDKISTKIKPAISEMEKIKNEINKLIKEKEDKNLEYNKVIQEKKHQFDHLKNSNSTMIVDLNNFKTELKKILKEATANRQIDKLELDK